MVLENGLLFRLGSSATVLNAIKEVAFERDVSIVMGLVSPVLADLGALVNRKGIPSFEEGFHHGTFRLA